MKKLVFLLFLGFLSTISIAGEVISKIKRTGVANSEFYMLQLETPSTTKPECASTYDVFSIDRKSDDGKFINSDMFSVAMTAFVSDKKVVIAFSDVDCGLWGTRPEIIRIDLVK